MDFAEKYGPWAVIAGASEGTGAEFARQLAEKGLNLVLIARRPGPLEALAEEIRGRTGRACVTARIDLAKADAQARIVEAVGGRDVGLYVGNAGADPNGSRFLDKPIDAWLELVRLNVITTIQCCHHFGGQMRARGRGGLLLVNSYACYGGGSFLACYTGSKAFELCFAESLWAELKPHGVDVLTLVMGMTDTPAFNALLQAKGMALPSGWASPHEVAAAGIANLANGPVCNWSAADDEAGMAPMSAAQRRSRVEMVTLGNRAVFGE